MSEGAVPGNPVPDVTIVIVSYEDERRLPRAIRSALGQSLTSVEVIVVDDGSKDGSHAVAQDFAARYPGQVRAYQMPENTGSAGAPRNLGIEKARGTFVMFLDSDDELEPNACRNLVSVAEETGAELVSGVTVRVYANRAGKREDWHPWLYQEQRVLQSVTEEPGLLSHDTLSTNKCYRREFLIENELRYPVGIVYEDLLFAVDALLAAKRIALTPHRVYLWYVREENYRLSITNSRHEIANVADRMEIHRRIDERLQPEHLAAIRLVKNRKFLEADLLIHLRSFPRESAEYRQAFLALVQPYLESMDPQAFEECNTIARVCAELVRRGAWDRLPAAVDTLLSPGRAPDSLFEHDGRVYWYDSGIPDDARMEVTDLGLSGLPVRKGSLRNVLTSLKREGAEITMSGRIANPFETIPATAKLGLSVEFSARRRSVRKYRITLDPPRHAGGELLWSARFRMDKTVRPLGVVDPVWDPNMVLTVDGKKVKVPIVVGEDPELVAIFPAMAFPVSPMLSRFVGDCFVPEVSAQGHLAFICKAHGGPARAGTAALRKLRTSGTGRWLRYSVVARLGRIRRKVGSTAFKTKVYSRRLTRLPVLKGSAVFESHMGRQYSDSPRAIYEELRRRQPKARVTWSYATSKEGFPKDAHLVKRGSWKYYMALARAEFWVDNQGFPHALPKRPETHYLQTWHGSALKKMGADIPSYRASSRDEQERMEQAVGRFDSFLVRSEHDVDTLVRALGVTGEVLRTGYPRNDALVNRGAGYEAELAELRKKLGLPVDRKVLLYAPTFRQDANGRVQPTIPPFDLRGFAERFGSEWSLLIRAHYLSAVNIPGGLGSTVLNASQVHDITPLLLISDALLTDYSSVLFDYALLDRPMFFLHHDRADYMEGRGAYFDLRENAPGPVVADEEGLFEALGRPDVAAEYATARKDFVARYGEYDQGRAAEEAVQRVFLGGPAPHPAPVPAEAAVTAAEAKAEVTR